MNSFIKSPLMLCFCCCLSKCPNHFHSEIIQFRISSLYLAQGLPSKKCGEKVPFLLTFPVSYVLFRRWQDRLHLGVGDGRKGKECTN